MIRRAIYTVLAGLLVASLTVSVQAVIKVSELETQYGELQGHLKMSDQTVLLFPTAKVKVSHATGLATVERIEAKIISDSNPVRPAEPDLRALKRKIDRLPAYEQVRYWKLHQIRYPHSNVDAELNDALDLVESLRQEAIANRLERAVEPEVVYRSYRPYRRSGSFYVPSYGYGSAYRYRRALRRDAQIGFERVYQPPRAESWDTAMSVADRGRAEALSLVEGGRSAILGNTR